MGIQHILKTVQYNKNVIEVSDDLLKIIQHQLLCMMEDIQVALEKHGIEWTLTAGSLLGAVRHKGFIPWDDDLDLVITREGYTILEKVFDEELSEKYILRKPGDSGYLLHYPQIHKRNTVMQCLQSTEDSADGLFIDIFILENTFDNVFLRTIHGIICSAMLFIDSSIRMQKCKKTILDHIESNKKVERAVQYRAFFSSFFAFCPFEKWLLVTDKIFSFVKTNSSVGVIPSGAKHFFGEIYNKKVFFPTKKVLFEGVEMRVPLYPERYLIQRYGNDYMEIPSVSNRERHIYIKLDLGE